MVSASSVQTVYQSKPIALEKNRNARPESLLS